MKVALTDASGVTLDICFAELQILRPKEEYCEMDMSVLWKDFGVLCRQLQERHPHEFNLISGVGITGQGDGLWPVDKKGVPVRNAILWNDTRTKNMLFSDWDRLSLEKSVNLPYTGSFHVLLLWTKKNEPEIYKKISHLFHCKDWIVFKLTDSLSSDYSDASLAGFNLFSKEFSADVFCEMDISEVESFLPKPVPSDSIAGYVGNEGSLETGLKKETPVIAGALDFCTMAHGTGAAERGDTTVIIGTTLCAEVVAEREQVNLRKETTACYIAPDLYLRVMSTLGGTNVLDWNRKLLFPNESYAAMEKKLSDVPLGSRGVLYHPYLYGERSPFRNPFARGGFYGLSAIHGREEMMRAVYEGLAMSLLDCLNEVSEAEESVTVCGGGAASDFLCQILADSTGKLVKRTPIPEAGIIGTAKILIKTLLMEEHAIGNKSPGKPNSKIFSPRAHCTERYQQLHGSFHKLKDSMENFWLERGNK